MDSEKKSSNIEKKITGHQLKYEENQISNS
jgi:hypothetical protein